MSTFSTEKNDQLSSKVAEPFAFLPTMTLTIFYMHTCHILTFFWVVHTLLVEFYEFRVFFGYQSFTTYVFCKDFLAVFALSFHYLNSVLLQVKYFLILMKSSLSILSFTDHASATVSNRSFIARPKDT